MKMKKMMAGLLIAMITLTGVGISPASANEVQAAVDVPTSIKYEPMSVTDTAPVKDGYLFGGWYSDENGENVIADKTTGEKAYAKFVPAYVLGIKAQNYASTARETDETKIAVNKTTTRLITAIDCVNYKEVGFEIIKEDGTEKAKAVTKVYNFLKVGEKSDYTAANVFGTGATFFAVLELKNIPQSAWGANTYVRPYWITMDDTKVTGLGKYVCVDDGIDGYLNVPINLKTAEAIAAGLLTVSYDKEKLTYDGFVAGKVFEEMAAAGADGTVKCVGNVDAAEDGTLSNTAADDMYISLRFKNNGHTFGIGDFLTFTITGADFCDVDEKTVSVNVWNVQY